MTSAGARDLDSSGDGHRPDGFLGRRTIGGAKVLGDVAATRNNNFDSLRLIAAVLVIVDHTFPLHGHEHLLADRLGITLGGLAVDSFFVISGFLIAKSWLDDSRVVAFVTKRVLRLMPALIVAVLFSALFIGGIATTLPFGEYVRDPMTVSFVKDNILLFPQKYTLPGVFADNPYPSAVNGSLWSLPIEVLAYGVVLALGLTRLLTRRTVVLALFAFTIYMRFHIEAKGWLGNGVWFYMTTLQIWELLSIFLIGTLMYLYREHIVLSGRVALALVVLWIVTLETPYSVVMLDIAMPYTLLTLAYADLPWLQKLARPGDVSYGIYIYAFPIQQLLAAHRPGMNPWLALAVTIPATYVVALISWHAIEKPSLRLKRLVRRRPTALDSREPRREAAELPLPAPASQP